MGSYKAVSSHRKQWDIFLPLFWNNIFSKERFIMRKIKELLADAEKVWGYLGEDSTLKSAFSDEVNEMGFAFSNGELITAAQISRIMAVHADGKLTHVSLMVWTAAFKPGDGSCGIRHNFDEIPKIDYRKFISDEDSYLIKSCNFKRIL
jgi:hypothetical protein